MNHVLNIHNTQFDLISLCRAVMPELFDESLDIFDQMGILRLENNAYRAMLQERVHVCVLSPRPP